MKVESEMRDSGMYRYLLKNRSLMLLWSGKSISIIGDVFMGPLYPALVKTQLHGNASYYGLIEASFIVGGLLGGLGIHFFEKRFPVGFTLWLSLLIAAFSTFGIAFSHNLFLTLACQIIQSIFTTLLSILIMSSLLVLVSVEFRGRITGVIFSFMNGVSSSEGLSGKTKPLPTSI